MSDVNDTKSSASQPAAKRHRERLPHVPRLSIGYLLVWTAVTAALLAVPTGFNVEGGKLPGRYFVSLLASRMFSGAAVAGCGLILWHARRRTLWPLEPGEWLIVAEAVVYLPVVVWSVAAPFFQTAPDILPVYLFTLLPALARGAVAVCARRTPWWSALLWVGAISDLLVTILLVFDLSFFQFAGIPYFGWFHGSRLFKSLLLLSLLTIALAVDHRRLKQRHWLHWTGAVVVGGLEVKTLLFFIWQTVVRS